MVRGLELGPQTVWTPLHSCNRARVARLLSPPCSRAKKLTGCQRGEGFDHQGPSWGPFPGSLTTGSLTNVCSSLQLIYPLPAMNKHFKSIIHCCKQYSSYCCYLLLHLLNIYSDLILFRCISKNPLIEAKWKTLNAHCFVCVVKIIQKIHIVQIPQVSKLTLL